MRPTLVLVVAALSAFGLIASDVYLPAMPVMAQQLGIAGWQMPQTVAVYLMALAAAQLCYGPLSDRWGRKPVLVAGILLYIAGSIGCALAVGFTSFLGWRMVEAVGAASGLVIGRAVIADTCDKKASAKVYSVVYPLVSLSPALAPAIGGYLAAAFGWRADFIFVAVFGAIALCLTLMLLNETGPKKRHDGAFLAGFTVVLRNGAFIRYALVVCAIYCAWFVYLTQSPFLFERLGLPETVSGWLYLPLTCGIILANFVSKRLIEHLSYDGIVAGGVCFFCLGGLTFVLTLASPVMCAATIVAPMFLVSLSNGSSLSLAVSGAIASEPKHAATASGLVGFFQIGSASLAALGVSACFGTGRAVLAIAILVFSIIAATAIIPHWIEARRRL
ncbi:DHA1 family bicyclomycin/chloramphenicol resistance-like MFS transporter [Bradyrhizobium sp. USDA 4524]|uniref:multidrug effflux MFS transporter n=1 Tax=Bradyrhizobium TaxID=374 RepID=UPI00209E849D|nr:MULTISPECIES: multidrug effflux MFS transporter [Bradyrhizobium]MCP1840160.1 DHA1 family bicyclomycin/chloramphenicol resistance-like MFS transporter [Bradyrhizobium sp. USDA 4538]MCP1900723.1 DHA1 family bicyclomycin/chloramphenicol resistance-like MFS transporter [Bradyrhizobium sp. USDA 4537]MCP1993621.1 DHA1 family bicyclomycin/chloramphenicol resistance-like MFS transporter [Bradyrhizobium sp. USDA 4539]MCP3416881.1 multidrug effflux MFS transporter [Bradyrhizobium brasilense]